MNIADFEIEVERKKIKNLHLAVYPPDGRVHVSVPENINDDDLGMFLYSKLSWIRSKREEVIAQERQTKREFVTGESHYLLGHRYLLKVLYSAEKAHVIKNASYIEMYVKHHATLSHKEEVMDEFYREELRSVLEPLVTKWAIILQEEKTPFTWTVLLMQKQWGSCMTVERKIQFNLLLARVPRRCIEYVVVHELVHLRIHEHNTDFILLMNQHLPDWRMRKKELDEFIALPIK